MTDREKYYVGIEWAKQGSLLCLYLKRRIDK